MMSVFSDPRHLQIAVLGSLLCFLIVQNDFAPDLEVVALLIGTSLLTQYVCMKYVGMPVIDLRSGFITSLSLCLLFKAASLWIYPLAAIAAISSKFFIRYENKHLFNPANFAIVAGLIVFPDLVWVSPGQWGSDVWLGFALAGAAAVVLASARRGDISLFFLVFWAALIFGRALWLGDPLSIPLHQFQSGALLIFAFFMISDPKTTPDSRVGRMIFALMTAILAFTLSFGFQVREALFYALFAICVLTPFLDRIFKGPVYKWRLT